MKNIEEKIVSLKELINVVKKLRKSNKKIITTNGVFDILHLGHVKYLEEAKKLGDILIVGVNVDSSVKKIKGEKRPINNKKSRIGVLAALESVDYVFLFDEKDPRSWLLKIKPDMHVKAGDYKMNQIIEKNIVEKNNGRLVIIPMIRGYSTTNIIKKILNSHK